MDHHHANLGDVRLHYVTAGQGFPVVLLHGWPQSWYEWRHVIADLAKSHFVIAPDLRGLGDSSRPAEGYDKRTIGHDIWRLVHDVLGIGAFHLVGHDWGGPTAYAVAAAHPDAGLLIGRGYSYGSVAGDCAAGSVCKGGKAGLLFGSGGDGSRGGNGGDASRG